MARAYAEVLAAWSVRFVGWVEWVDCRCFLFFVFLGVARRLELSPCNTATSHNNIIYFPLVSALSLTSNYLPARV